MPSTCKRAREAGRAALTDVQVMAIEQCPRRLHFQSDPARVWGAGSSRLKDKEGDEASPGALQAWGRGTGHRVALPLTLL